MEKTLVKKLDIEFNSMDVSTIGTPTRYDDFIAKLTETDCNTILNTYRLLDGCEPDPEKQWFNYHLRMLALRLLYIRLARVDPLNNTVSA